MSVLMCSQMIKAKIPPKLPQTLSKFAKLFTKKENTNEAKRILAIAYFHNKQIEEADSIWNELKM